jgi:hypothetical protein
MSSMSDDAKTESLAGPLAKDLPVDSVNIPFGDGKLRNSDDQSISNSSNPQVASQHTEEPPSRATSSRAENDIPTLEVPATSETTTQLTSQETESTEPILRLVHDCDALFEESAIGVQNVPSLARASVEEYTRRFKAWSRYCGVFAGQKINLDRRVRHKPRIQDIIIRLLLSLRRNLVACKSVNVASATSH